MFKEMEFILVAIIFAVLFSVTMLFLAVSVGQGKSKKTDDELQEKFLEEYNTKRKQKAN